MRSACHLCEAMEHELSVFISKGELQVHRIYIDNDVSLIQLYGERIPVLMYEQRLICEYFLDVDKLQQVLHPSIELKPTELKSEK